MKRILFVDDDVNVLNGLRRGLHSMRGEWQMEFTDSAERAIDILDKGRFDAVVTDIRMRHMDGFQLLRETKNSYPQVLRIVLSGQTEQEALARGLASTHLFLGKPCDTEIVKSRVRDILTRGDQIRDNTLKGLIVQLGGISSLAELFFDVMKLINEENPDIDKVAQIVSMDMGMASMILHFVNSGYFGPATTTSNPERAVRWLGVETVRDLIVRNRLCCSFDSGGFKYFDILKLWSQSILLATSARNVARARSNDTVLADDAFAAGLFRDVGQIVLATVLGHFYDSVLERALTRGEELWKTEREMIGSSHAEVGAYLLGLWGIPETVVNAVAAHHECTDTGEFNALSAVIAGEEVGDKALC